MGASISDNGSSPIDFVRWISPIHVVLLLIPLLAWYIYSYLKWQRYGRFRGIPEAPNKSLVWGHLAVMGKEIQKSRVDGNLHTHVDYTFHRIYQSLPEQKGVMVLDMWPAQHSMLYVASHRVAEQLSRSSKQFRYSVYKSPTVHQFDDLIGKESMLSENGEAWKSYRKMFNPGFAPNHLITLLPQILDKTKIFMARLDTLAKSGVEFETERLYTNLTFDIIGIVALGIDLNAQQDDVSEQHPIVQEFSNVFPYFENLYSIQASPITLVKRWLAGKKLEKAVEAVIWQKWNEMLKDQTSGAAGKEKDKSVLALALQDLPELNSATARATASQLRTFLFAGHDTTSSLLQWATYKLSRDESARATLKNELDSVYGKGDIVEMLSTADGESRLSQLPYTSAIIKETLRLYPPAGSARKTPPGTGLRLHLDDDSEILADDLVIWMNHYGIHRDLSAYGPDAEVWKPERWVGDTETSADNTNGGNDVDSKDDATGGQKKPNEIPASAWRPFERGPRNCIGQELANLEARVILACIARKYVFQKVGFGSKEGEEPLNKAQITAKPLDGMRMRVRFAKDA